VFLYPLVWFYTVLGTFKIFRYFHCISLCYFLGSKNGPSNRSKLALSSKSKDLGAETFINEDYSGEHFVTNLVKKYLLHTARDIAIDLSVWW